MKGSDIVNQLRQLLPIFTNDFTDQVNITSLVRSGSTVTATTDKDHLLLTDNNITVAGAKEPITITSLTRSGTTVTATCSTAHKLPKPELIRKDSPILVEVTGVTPNDYNGTYKLTETPSNLIFQYQITTTPASPAASGGFLLLQDTFLYNGIKKITVTDVKTFTYEIESQNLQSPAQGTIILHKDNRILLVSDFEIAFDDYTSDSEREFQNRMYVVLGDREAFNKGTTAIDPSALQNANSEYRYDTLNPFQIFTFVPSSDFRLAGVPSDQARGYIKPLMKSIGNFLLPSSLSECKFNPVTYQGDGMELREKAYYVHRFDFAALGELRNEDTIDQIRVVALQELDADFDKDLQVKIDF